MHKSFALVYKTIFIIKYFRISRINNILNNMSELIHFCFLKLINFLLFILPALFSVFSHHIFFTNLIITFTHPLLYLLLKPLKFLYLNKLNVFQRALRRLFLLWKQHFWKQWFRWNWNLFFFVLFIWFWRLLAFNILILYLILISLI